MNLYLLRHGLAAPSLSAGARADALRPLTPKGRRKVEKIARAMKRMDLGLELILSSPLTRARQTALIVAEVLGLSRQVEFVRELEARTTPAAILAQLGRTRLPPENILLVGHEPSLSGLVSLLLSGSTALRVQLKKGGLCKLSLRRFQPGERATLEWLLTPGQMLDMG